MKMLLNHTCFFVLGGEIPNMNVAEGKQLLGIWRANIQEAFPLEPDIQIDLWVYLGDWSDVYNIDMVLYCIGHAVQQSRYTSTTKIYNNFKC